MKRDTLAGYLVEIDEERGTFAIHTTWARNLVQILLSLAVSGFFGVWGVGIIGCAWFGTPGIPVAQWGWLDALMFRALSVFSTVVGLCCLYVPVGSLCKITLSLVRGFPPSVLDRGEGRCREGKATVFRLDGLDSLHIAEEGGGEGGIYYVLHFQFREGKPRNWLESCSATRTSCEALGLAVARFLNVPIMGIETAEKEPLPEL